MRRIAGLFPVALALAAQSGAAIGQTSMAAGKPEAALWSAAQASKADALDLLKSVVVIDSGSDNPQGATEVENIFAGRLRALGAEIRTVPTEQAGYADAVVATLHGTGKGRILIIAHVDTVFSRGAAAKRGFSVGEDGRARGPGVGDEKGGDVCAIEALTLLKSLGFRRYASVTVLLDTSEESGSPSTMKLIAALAKDADVEFNMEPGPPVGPNDGIDVWRKGATAIVITVRGKAAHSGMAPEDGRNAATELVHQLWVLHDAFPLSGEEATVNLTLMKGGERDNIIPAFAQANLDVRFRTDAQFDAILAKVKQSAKTTVVPDVKVEVSGEGSFPPLFIDPVGKALTAQAQAVYREIGRTLETHGTGGASESALAQAVGAPALDGLGFVGGDFHTDKEWIDTNSIPARIYLTARLIEILGETPPAKPRS